VTRARDALNARARERLSWDGVTAVGWARWCFPDSGGAWFGDRCGCPDDRCMDGYHHDPYEDCGCLDALLSERARGSARWGDLTFLPSP
jgi:hypothetical protein